MDVSIAVSLIRGQMGAVVERAVNGAVETVLAEMLKVVGVKFEELKAQLMLMKREVAALQREKALKEKENDNIRAKLRYTELKLKYYRQGVEEELQQRAATLVYIHPHSFPRTQRGGATEATTSCSAQSSTTEEETVVERSSGVSQEDEWSFSVQPEAERLQMLEDQPDASMLPPSGLQVKQEEVICIKEEEPEPEEEQEEQEEEEVTAMMQPAPHPETERTVMDWSRLNQTSPDASYPPSSSSSSSSSPPSVAPPQPGAPPRPASRPWTKDLGLYEDYKLRRNDLRRRNLNRRRELEKTLPQPLLADLLQERREKTRLRVARWRAKRKLQACLNQAQPHGGAAALSLSRLSFPVGLQHQQLRASNQSSASSPSSSVLRNMSASVSAVPPIPPPPSSSSSSSHPQVSQSQQSISPTHTELHT